MYHQGRISKGPSGIIFIRMTAYECYGISNQWQIVCVLNSLFRLTTKKLWMVCITGPLREESTRANNVEIIWWHNVIMCITHWHAVISFITGVGADADDSQGDCSISQRDGTVTQSLPRGGAHITWSPHQSQRGRWEVSIMGLLSGYPSGEVSATQLKIKHPCMKSLAVNLQIRVAAT